MNTFDLIVIGAGPGGYVAAIRAAQLGLKVALVEREQLGGICLNWGCIPTKALLKSADLFRSIQDAKAFGIDVPKASFQFERIFARSRQVSEKLVAGVQYLTKKNKITVIEGEAYFEKNKTLRVGNQALEAKNIIIATGARPRTFTESTAKSIWYYRQALAPDIFPKRLVVVGSGAIGIEFASFYRTFGVEVTVLEASDRILMTEDVEIADLAQKAFAKQGMKIFTQAHITSIQESKKTTQVTFTVGADKKPQVVECERVIMAIGVVPNVENIGLENVAVQLTPKGYIQIDATGQTTNPNIWAIGDVAGPPCLAHKASHEAVSVVESIASRLQGAASSLAPHALSKTNIPGCIYSHPQIASIGLTEEEAKNEGLPIKVGKFPYMGNGKAIALGELEGLIKTIFHKDTGELLGAHMIGSEVTELIGTYSLGKTLETTEAEIIQTIFPHPTLSEMLHESVLSAMGRPLHI